MRIFSKLPFDRRKWFLYPLLALCLFLLAKEISTLSGHLHL